jgi:hypothetical protein
METGGPLLGVTSFVPPFMEGTIPATKPRGVSDELLVDPSLSGTMHTFRADVAACLDSTIVIFVHDKRRGGSLKLFATSTVNEAVDTVLHAVFTDHANDRVSFQYVERSFRLYGNAIIPTAPAPSTDAGDVVRVWYRSVDIQRKPIVLQSLPWFAITDDESQPDVLMWRGPFQTRECAHNSCGSSAIRVVQSTDASYFFRDVDSNRVHGPYGSLDSLRFSHPQSRDNNDVDVLFVPHQMKPTKRTKRTKRDNPFVQSDQLGARQRMKTATDNDDNNNDDDDVWTQLNRRTMLCGDMALSDFAADFAAGSTLGTPEKFREMMKRDFDIDMTREQSYWMHHALSNHSSSDLFCDEPQDWLLLDPASPLLRNPTLPMPSPPPPPSSKIAIAIGGNKVQSQSQHENPNKWYVTVLGDGDSCRKFGPFDSYVKAKKARPNNGDFHACIISRGKDVRSHGSTSDSPFTMDKTTRGFVHLTIGSPKQPNRSRSH